MQKKKPNPLFVLAADEYANEVLALHKYGTHKNNLRIVKHLSAYFGHFHVQSITKSDIQKYIVQLSQQSGAAAVFNYMKVFKAIMEYADDEWEMPSRLKKPRMAKPKQELYMFDEVRRLIANSREQTQVLIMLLAETGMRLGEALALGPSDVVDSVISVNKNVYLGWVQDSPKTDSSVRKICISNTLYESLQTLYGHKYLFHTRSGRPAWPQTLVDELREICKKAGVEYKAFHAFRRGNITELILNLLIPERIVGMRCGHLSDSVTLGVYCKAMPGSDKPWVPLIEQSLYGEK